MSNLRQLLSTWNLEYILPHLIDQEIDGETLKVMKLSHIKALLCDFPLGIQIRFEHHLEQWRYRIGKPLQYDAYHEANPFDPNQSPEHIAVSKEMNSDHNRTGIKTQLENSPSCINLNEILMQSQAEGLELLDIYRRNQCLSNPERSLLIEIIVNYYLKNNLPFDLHTSYDLENAILSQFPSESLEFYRKTSQGKIYRKYLASKIVYDNKESHGKSDGIGRNENTVSNGELNEILLQTVYNDSRKFIKILKPFLYQGFFSAVCSSFNVTQRQNFYIAINECEISPEDFKNVILQYYNLPTFAVELKQREIETKMEHFENTCSMADLYNQPSIYTPMKNFNTNEGKNAAVQIIVNHLPDANDIRNIPALLPIVKMSDDGRPLENKHRTAIAKALIDECLNFQPERVLKRQDFFTLTDSIIEAFPNETASAYFIPSQPNQAARGKLWNAYNNKRSFLGSSGIVQRRPQNNPNKRKLQSDEDEGSEKTNDKMYISDNLVECKEFSLNSILDWDTLQQKWIDCHTQRRNELLKDKMPPQYYMQKYSILKSNRGIDLMEIDVNILHPTVVNINNWLSLHEKVIEMGRKLLKVEQIPKLLENIDSSNDEKYRASLALLILPYIFPYNARRNEFNEKASKLDIQKRFIKEYASLDDLKADSDGADIQLRFVHHDQRINYAEFKICGHVFKCVDLLEALSSIFHYTVALNMEYPKICLHIWQFIQLAIFQIEIQGCKQPNVESTISDLYMI